MLQHSEYMLQTLNLISSTMWTGHTSTYLWSQHWAGRIKKRDRECRSPFCEGMFREQGRMLHVLLYCSLLHSSETGSQKPGSRLVIKLSSPLSTPSTCPAFYVGAGDLNTDHHACRVLVSFWQLNTNWNPWKERPSVEELPPPDWFVDMWDIANWWWRIA